MTTGKILIFLGVLILILGLVLHFAPGVLSWFGHLPGDIRIGSKNRFIFIPITSMIIISIVLTVIINVFSRK